MDARSYFGKISEGFPDEFTTSNFPVASNTIHNLAFLTSINPTEPNQTYEENPPAPDSAARWWSNLKPVRHCPRQNCDWRGEF
jgi:hypothetical protein